MDLNIEFMKVTFVKVLAGIPVTGKLVVVTLLITIPLGFIIAILRQNSKSIVSKILGVYISFARGTPTMVHIYLLYTALPLAVAKHSQEVGSSFTLYNIKGMIFAYIILSFGMLAIMAETFRAGLLAVDKGQLESARATGLSTFQGYRRIVIPQAFVNILPIMCNNVTGLVKMSSLVFAVSVFEITGIAKIEGAKFTCYVEAYLIIAVFYVVINLLIELIFKLIEKKVHLYHSL
jgi:L-cystine transport system permease protein